MKCPNDSTVLVIQSGEDRTGWKCSTCSGVWLPRSYVIAFEISYPDLLSPFYKSSGIDDDSTSNLQCPEGHGRLSQSESYGIELDWCDACHGFWFDKDELTKIQTVARGDENLSLGSGWADLLWFLPGDW